MGTFLSNMEVIEMRRKYFVSLVSLVMSLMLNLAIWGESYAAPGDRIAVIALKSDAWPAKEKARGLTDQVRKEVSQLLGAHYSVLDA